MLPENLKHLYQRLLIDGNNIVDRSRIIYFTNDVNKSHKNSQGNFPLLLHKTASMKSTLCKKFLTDGFFLTTLIKTTGREKAGRFPLYLSFRAVSEILKKSIEFFLITCIVFSLNERDIDRLLTFGDEKCF